MTLMNTAKELTETEGSIVITAPGKSDFFIDEMNDIKKNDAPFYYEKRKGDFVIRTRVRPEFKKKYDAGGLFIHDSEKKWIKLEFENTDLGYPSVVSVKTDGVSDDCNGEKQEGCDEVELQIVRKGDHWALHYSIDGRKWKMVRYFKLKMKKEVKIGLESQSPAGTGCRVTFSKFKISGYAVRNMRKGI